MEEMMGTSGLPEQVRVGTRLRMVGGKVVGGGRKGGGEKGGGEEGVVLSRKGKQSVEDFMDEEDKLDHVVRMRKGAMMGEGKRKRKRMVGREGEGEWGMEDEEEMMLYGMSSQPLRGGGGRRCPL